VLAACDCARLALVHVPAGEHRPRLAIEIAERWAGGDASVSLGDVMRAAYATYAAAAYATYAAAATNAAYAANAAVDARTETLRKCADIARKHIPLGMIQAALDKKGGE
jgi:hypothetical protein